MATIGHPVQSVLPNARVRKTLDQITGTLNGAAKGSQPSKPSYKEGLVLYLSWEPNTSLVRAARHQFLRHFAEKWGFTTDMYEVPVVDSAIGLEQKLRDLKAVWAEKEDCVIVVVIYGYMAISDEAGRACWG